MAKRDWLDAGLAILAEQGAPALTIERLTGRLGLSKGSFYHHFNGMGGYTAALADHYEVEHTTRFIDTVEQDASAAPWTKLQRLMELVLSEDEGPELEIAMRAWALQNTQIGEMQQRVDATRTNYLRELWAGISGDEAEAAEMGQLLYLISVGAGHVIPAIEPVRLRSLYELAMRLPSAAAGGAPVAGRLDARHAVQGPLP